MNSKGLMASADGKVAASFLLRTLRVDPRIRRLLSGPGSRTLWMVKPSH